MATVKQDQFLSRPVAADYSSYEYYLMALNSSDQWARASVLGQVVAGVLEDDPDTAGDLGSCRVFGQGKVKLSGAVSEGEPLVATTTGAAIKRSDLNQYVFGRALEPGIDGQIIEFLFKHEGIES